MKEYTYTNNEIEFIVLAGNVYSAKSKAEEMQRNNLLNSGDYTLTLIRIKELKED